MDREFKGVRFPRLSWPLVDGADEKLAAALPGIRVCLEDPEEDPAFFPEEDRQPLGTVKSATAAGDHVLAAVSIDTDAVGASQIIAGLERGELRFGLWGTAEVDPATHEIVGLRPTSVRISNTRPLR